MAAKSSKVFLELAGRDHTNRENREAWVYRVVRLVNTLEPRIDSLVKDTTVEQMIREGIDVTISPRNDRMV